jgi:hypothetical protein
MASETVGGEEERSRTAHSTLKRREEGERGESNKIKLFL